MTLPLPINPRKPLPKAFRSRSLSYDYGLVKYRKRREGYKASGQTVDFDVVQVGTLDAQVRVHFFLEGKDKYSGKSEIVDVDFYLPIATFRKASGLLRGMRFKRDSRNVLRVRKWK
jgi:hypothetical protein